MDCAKCGGDNREGAHFCRHCGEELAASSPGESPSEQGALLDIAADNQGDKPAIEEAPDSQEEAAVETGKVATEGEPAEALTEPLPDEAEDESEGDVEPEAGREEAAGVDADLELVEDLTSVEDLPEVEVQASALEPVEMESEPDPRQPAEEPDPELQDELQAAGSDAGPDELSATDPVAGEALEYQEEGVEVPPLPEWIEEEMEGEEDLLAEPEVEVAAFWREPVEPTIPLPEGSVIADRYVVLDVLDAQEETILYYARDLRRCWQCGYEGNAPDEAFCAQCGATLDRKPSARLLEVRDPEFKPETGESVAARLVHEERTLLLLGEPEYEPEAKPKARNIRLVVGQDSDAGLVRELDEDSLLSMTLAPTYESRTSPVLGLFAVADGMGGHEGGEVASKLALQVLADHVLRTIVLPELAGDFILDEDIVVRLRQATMDANDRVYLARQKRGNDMGTTLTTVLIRDDRLFVAHVGDCRAYRWNADGLQQLTVDHSVVASMIANGRAAPEDIYTHPHRSVIYRCVGDQPEVQVDTDVLRLAHGDRIIVCCDGLWEMIRDEGIEDVMMQEADPQAACKLFVKRANAAGGEDNISVIVVQVEAA